jgi:hypothetical protein
MLQSDLVDLTGREESVVICQMSEQTLCSGWWGGGDMGSWEGGEDSQWEAWETGQRKMVR